MKNQAEVICGARRSHSPHGFRGYITVKDGPATWTHVVTSFARLNRADAIADAAAYAREELRGEFSLREVRA